MRKTSLTLVVGFIAVAMLVTSNYDVQFAEGHGLGKEETQPQNVGDRIAFLRAQIVPEIKEAGEIRDVTLTMELVDAQTQEAIPGVAYHLSIEKFATGEILLEEPFHIMPDNDELVISFRTTESGEASVVRGQYMGDTLGYMTMDDGLIVEGPVFVDAGLYSFFVEVVAIEGETLDESEVAFYEALITLAESRTFEVEYEGETYDLEVISYFDKIQDFEFDSQEKNIRMTMEFDWREEFLEHIPLLHAEIFIPKEFSELAGQELVGTINGIEDPIFVDRSPPDEVVVHYMTPQNRLMTLSDRIMESGMDENVVEFGLISRGEAADGENGDMVEPPDPSTITEWSPVMETMTSGGSVKVQAQWSPVTIETGEPVTFRLEFIDPETNEEIENARYDVMLLNPEDEHINASHRSKQTGEFQVYSFDEMGQFTLLLTNVNFSGERAEFSINVVPEFPVAVLLVAGSMIAGMLLLMRFKGLDLSGIRTNP